MEKELFDSIKEINTDGMSKDEIIQAKIKYSNLISKVKKNAKQEKCILCGKDCTSFCNSHTIPQFVLKNIAKQGYLAHSYSGLSFPLIDEKTGIKKTITFDCICNECDNTLFQAYENPDNYASKVTPEMLSQIALKNTLRMYFKRLQEIELHTEMLQYDITCLQRINIDEIDLNDYRNEIYEIKRNKSNFYLIDEIDLDYRVPVAFQGICSLITGFDGELINDIYNLDPKYVIQGLHITIFPLSQSKTKIILFIKDGHIRYRSFYKRFKKLTLEERLYAINYILLLYTEDWVCEPSVIEILRNDDNIKNVIKTNSNSTIQYGNELDEIIFRTEIKEAAKEKFKLKYNGDLYNFLEYHNSDRN